MEVREEEVSVKGFGDEGPCKELKMVDLPVWG